VKKGEKVREGGGRKEKGKGGEGNKREGMGLKSPQSKFSGYVADCKCSNL